MALCDISYTLPDGSSALELVDVDLPLVRHGLSICFDHPTTKDGRRLSGMYIGEIAGLTPDCHGRYNVVVLGTSCTPQ